MKKSRRIAFFNIFLIIICVLDTFLLTPIEEEKVFERIRENSTRGYKSGSYRSIFVVTTDNENIQIANDENVYMRENDAMVLAKTKFFRRNLYIAYVIGKQPFKIKVGLLNDGRWFPKLFFAFCFLVSANQLMRKSVVNLHRYAFWIISATLWIMFLFYFMFY